MLVSYFAALGVETRFSTGTKRDSQALLPQPQEQVKQHPQPSRRRATSAPAGQSKGQQQATARHGKKQQQHQQQQQPSGTQQGAPKSLAQWPPPGVGATKLLQSRAQGGAPPVLSGVPVLPKSIGSDLGFMQFMNRVNKLGTAPPDPFLTGLEGAPTSLPAAASWQAPNPNHPAGGGNGTHASPRKWRDPFKLVNGQHVLDEQFEKFMTSVGLTLPPPPPVRHGALPFVSAPITSSTATSAASSLGSAAFAPPPKTAKDGRTSAAAAAAAAAAAPVAPMAAAAEPSTLAAAATVAAAGPSNSTLPMSTYVPGPSAGWGGAAPPFGAATPQPGAWPAWGAAGSAGVPSYFGAPAGTAMGGTGLGGGALPAAQGAFPAPAPAPGSSNPAYMSLLRAEAAAAQQRRRQAEAQGGSPAAGARATPASSSASSASAPPLQSVAQLRMPTADASRTVKQNADGSWSQGDGMGWRSISGQPPVGAGAAPRGGWAATAPASGAAANLVEHTASPAGAAWPHGGAQAAWPQQPMGAAQAGYGGYGGWSQPAFDPNSASLAGMSAWGLPGPGPAGGPQVA